MESVVVTKGDSPIILGLPHSGTHVPADIFARLNETGQGLTDTDWHVDKLYSNLLPGATMVAATFHRYVIDANRDPEGVSLYPGQNTTSLCPVTDFDGLPIYLEGQEPSAEEIETRRKNYHAAYHDALAAEISRVKEIHGIAILYDCHSIRSHIPFLFEGALPDFNVGTNGGATCSPAIEAAVVARTTAAKRYTSVLNGRFKGGWTTRHYGQPDTGVHAIQMELAQSTHLSTEAKPFAYELEKAGRIRPHLTSILEDLAAVAGDLCKTQPIKTENTPSGGSDNG
ncbi:N-formylglutamate deformylase [Roseibium algae]|uniref:N-formylglutamate deformylase n=1 Tax=Roseibium algae TaxID=3123038 RepID=A0ABU8TP71_9HYPH